MNDRKIINYEIAVGYFFSSMVVIIILIALFFMLKGDISLFRNKYVAFYEDGSGIKSGTSVSLNGLIIGEVTRVSIDDRNRIKVTMAVSRNYCDKIRTDSVAKIVRPLLIGSKQISISPGSQSNQAVRPGSVILSEESSEIVDLVSGISIDGFVKKLDLRGDFFDMTGDNMVTVRELYEQGVTALLTLNEFQKSIKMMNDSMLVLSYSIGGMSENLKAMGELSAKINQMNMALSQMTTLDKPMYEMGKSMDGVGDRFREISSVMSTFSTDSKDLKPTIEKISYLIDDLDILLKAMQQSWMFKADVDQVKKKLEKKKKK